MKTVYILMGLPGAGKSHWASQYIDVDVVSADSWMDTSSLGYVFDPQELSWAHAYCFERFLHLLQEGDRNIVVDNTNTTLIEVAPYIQACRALGARPVVVYIDCDPEVAAGRNTHGVPVEAVKAMYARLKMSLETWPPFWPKRVVVKGDDA